MRVLYVDCDSLRPDHLGCYGYHRDTSPNIDDLAADGRRYTNVYTSDGPCLPSRTAYFGGRFGVHTGVVNHSGINAEPRPRAASRGTDTAGAYRTLPRTLRDAGHRTAFVSPFPQRHGAWHTVDGFTEWIDTGGGGTDRADEVYPHAASWLDDHATEDDWYLHVNFWDPHTHYDTPTEYGTPFADDAPPAFPDADTIADQYESYGPHSARDLHHGYLTGTGAPDLPRVPDEIADRGDFRQWIDGYDVGIRYMDDHVGRLVDLLREAGVFEDTLVVVSADHGENQGELNVYGDHQTADDRTCRVPLVVSGPGVATGVDDALRYHLDVPPTLLELAGLDAPAGWDGQSFAPDLAGDGNDDGRDALVVGQGAWSAQRGVRFGDYLLLRTYHDGWKQFDPVELYDLAGDPHETTDLARDRPDLVREGLARLQAWRSARDLDAATGHRGGNPDAPRTLADPLFEVVREGGPTYLRGNRESYARRLRETGREAVADRLERGDLGPVEQDLSPYL